LLQGLAVLGAQPVESIDKRKLVFSNFYHGTPWHAFLHLDSNKIDDPMYENIFVPFL
jgi:hypothetical protein